MGKVKVTFTGSQGDELAGLLEQPSAAAKAYVLFAHCFTCSKDIAAASRISRALVEHGFAVFRFDITGLGSSYGDFPILTLRPTPMTLSPRPGISNSTTRHQRYLSDIALVAPLYSMLQGDYRLCVVL